MTCAISIFLIIALVGTSVAGTCPVLTPSGPVTITAHSQVVENLEIDTARGTATSPTSGISCNGFDHVIIRNVRVTHHVEGTSHPGLLFLLLILEKEEENIENKVDMFCLPG